MRRTAALLLAALFTLSTAAVAVYLQKRPASGDPAPRPKVTGHSAAGALRVSTELERHYLSESRGGEVYLQVNLAADGERSQGPRVPVNAVMILDRSGSMHGEKLDRARDAARALIEALRPNDHFAIVDFASDARVLIPSTDASPAAKQRALAAIDRLQATTGTNLSAAFALAAPQLRLGQEESRVDKIFLASDGQANEGISERGQLLHLAQVDFGGATVSSFGMGEDYDESFMTALAVQAGGRAQYVQQAEELPGMFEAELTRASQAVAHDVHLDVRGLSGAQVTRVLGFPADGGSVRLPDLAAGEERRVLIKLSVPPGRGTAELASVEVTFRDGRGATQRVAQKTQAVYTADRARLEEKSNQISWQGAMAEMADSASQAVRYQAEGRLEEAKVAEERLGQVAAQASAGAPASAARVLKERGASYGLQLRASGGGNQAARKSLAASAASDASVPVDF